MGDTPPIVSIVIVTRDRAEDLDYTLRSLASERGRGWEVIVVSNNSSDGTVETVRRQFPWVLLVARNDNHGIGATNYGLALASAPIVLLLDDDAHPRIGTVSRALKLFDTDPSLQVLACAIEENGVIVNAHWAPETLGYIGCGVFYRRTLAQEIGGHSWFVDWYGNEREFSARVLAAGHTIRFDTECVVVHRRSPTNRSWRHTIRNHAKGTLYRVVRYQSAWCIPFGVALALVYSARETYRYERPRLRDVSSFIRGAWEGLRGGLADRSVIPRPMRLRAGAIWRAQVSQSGSAGRWLARVAPRDFWH